MKHLLWFIKIVITRLCSRYSRTVLIIWFRPI